MSMTIPSIQYDATAPVQPRHGQPHGTGVRQLQMSEDTAVPSAILRNVLPPCVSRKVFLDNQNNWNSKKLFKKIPSFFLIFEILFFEIKILRLNKNFEKIKNENNLKNLKKSHRNSQKKSSKNLIVQP